MCLCVCACARACVCVCVDMYVDARRCVFRVLMCVYVQMALISKSYCISLRSVILMLLTACGANGWQHDFMLWVYAARKSTTDRFYSCIFIHLFIAIR